MKYAFVIEGGEPKLMADLASEAEAAGWDAVLIADGIAVGMPNMPSIPWFDPWVTLAAMAMRTQRIRIGTLITPVTRRRPWKLARETVSIDHLSDGRLILGVGLGAAEHDGGFSKVGEAMELKARAERTDEGLAILDGLWSGKPLSFAGKHYQVDDMTMLPTPVQSPRIPVWVVGVWPKTKSMKRAISWDGLIPQVYKADMGYTITPDEIRAMKAFIEEHRTDSAPYDVIVGGSTPGKNRKKAMAKVRPYGEAGGTWWLEYMWASVDKMRERIKQGPPRIE
jgi:hypothetical protein